ncbi:sufE-like protein 2, chloroplastic [Salvia hispanica]|uniref:sufE-like protein 2, chloroplastic n=1 Tax=Salvia hispanica TaxID=49212 RepID=UPI0020093181|nr:sufE-like protein 2, chloroplastic [Salvia hispanica]XP_047959539.1 sufE-like protein 2, chloroplastic [Salvia hispanica]XP_047959540.1 sufE-like protein 2, chloroplastic [Salvia hispanica]
MGSFTARTHLSTSPPPFFTNPPKTNFMDAGPSHIHLNPRKPASKNPPVSRFPLNPTSKNPIFPLSCVAIEHYKPSSSVSEKLQRLGFEFRSLPAPIDRVRRLLQYAEILPPFDESWRVQENRVQGCATQVWLEAGMDGNGAMRFRIDSDSEITKGFCSCLIWVLDGAAAEEVLSVRADDLVAMNVGLPSKGNSRVNAWNNVLMSMQRRTQVLVEERRTSFYLL